MRARERINQIVRERLDREKEKGMMMFDPEFLQDELIESIIIYLEEKNI